MGGGGGGGGSGVTETAEERGCCDRWWWWWLSSWSEPTFSVETAAVGDEKAMGREAGGEAVAVAWSGVICVEF